MESYPVQACVKSVQLLLTIEAIVCSWPKGNASSLILRCFDTSSEMLPFGRRSQSPVPSVMNDANPPTHASPHIHSPPPLARLLASLPTDRGGAPITPHRSFHASSIAPFIIGACKCPSLPGFTKSKTHASKKKLGRAILLPASLAKFPRPIKLPNSQTPTPQRCPPHCPSRAKAVSQSMTAQIPPASTSGATCPGPEDSMQRSAR